MKDLDLRIFKSIPHYSNKGEQEKSTKEHYTLANLLGFIKDQEGLKFKNFEKVNAQNKPDFKGYYNDSNKVYVELTDAVKLPRSTSNPKINPHQSNQTAINIIGEVSNEVRNLIGDSNEKVNITVTFRLNPSPIWGRVKSKLPHYILDLINEARNTNNEHFNKFIKVNELKSLLGDLGIEWILFHYYKNNAWQEVYINANELDVLERDVVNEIDERIKEKEGKNYQLDSECWLCITLEFDWANDFKQIDNHKFTSNFFKRVYLVEEDMDEKFGAKRIV